MIRNILVGYDGSEAAAHELTFAAGLARTFGSSVHVLAIVRPPEFGGMVETEAVIEQSRKHYSLATADSTAPKRFIADDFVGVASDGTQYNKQHPIIRHAATALRALPCAAVAP